MTVVVDTGPLYALLDRSDAWHARVTAWWGSHPRQLFVPSTVLPEVCFLLHTRISAAAERAFVRAVADGEFQIEPLESEDISRASSVMQEYGDLPLGFVDATVIAIAERLGVRNILTTDRRHFDVVRPSNGGTFTLLP